jgi:nucleotide-binding universal stress UspA family protein
MITIKRILCPIDFSEYSRQATTDFSASSLKALSYASSIAERANAEVTVLHVLESMPAFEPVVVGVPWTPEYRQLAEAVGRERLHELLVGRPDVNREAREIVASGKPYREILRVATEQQSDLIVMGVHGGPAGLPAFGSTLNHVVRQATCPILSVRG